MKDIFDIKDISDIPAIVANNLTSLRMSSPVKQLISLFKIKNSLTIDEVLVGSFRKHKKTYARSYVSCILYNLYRRGLLKKQKAAYMN